MDAEHVTAGTWAADLQLDARSCPGTPIVPAIRPNASGAMRIASRTRAGETWGGDMTTPYNVAVVGLITPASLPLRIAIIHRLKG